MILEMATETQQENQNKVDEKSIYSQDELPDLLPVYYKRLFPYGLYYRWLNYGGVPKSYFTNREFSFTLKDDIYIRYQSFGDQQEMEKEIQKRCPYKIDIGAVFTHRPKDHKTVKATAFQAQEKELVFDIDMTDYDDVRTCCDGAAICKRCWPLMTVAIKVMDRALRDDFGFEHLLWVYSGRRGVHCWIADEAARKLSQAARTAVAEYLSLVKGGENQTKKVNLPQQLHPSIERAQRIVEKYFKEFALINQGILSEKESRDKLLSLVPDDKLREILEEELNKNDKKIPEQRWERVKNWVTSEINRGHAVKCKNLITEIMFQYVYPRLDVNVSTGVNHLLKSPFCIHPKTGRVCVPIDPNDAENFDPLIVPDISQLCSEIDEYDKAHSTTNDENQPPNKKRVKDYKKTSMNTSVEVFEKFVIGLEATWKGKLLEQSDQQMDF